MVKRGRNRKKREKWQKEGEIVKRGSNGKKREKRQKEGEMANRGRNGQKREKFWSFVYSERRGKQITKSSRPDLRIRP